MMLTIGAITLCLSLSIISGHELTNVVDVLEKIVTILEKSTVNGIPSPNPTCAPCSNQTCSRCPDKWIQFKSSCYLFVNGSLTWHQAKSNCQAQGAYLVHVNDKNESSFLQNHLENLAANPYWIGLTDADKEGQFKWDGGDGCLPFTDWAPGQPDDTQENEDCVHFRQTTYKWNDWPCGLTIRSICEKSI